jgi:hypothetical protein
MPTPSTRPHKKPPPTSPQHRTKRRIPATPCMKALEDQDPLWELDSFETLPEMEREIGMADWIDLETGEPAEGLSPPHLDAD